MIITIVSPGQFITQSTEEPEVGRSYLLEDATTGTNAQNRLFHALIGEYWRSGAHSYDAKNYDDFRNCIKKKLGAGFEAYVYAVIENGKPIIKDAKTRGDIPKEVREDPDLKKLVRGRLKSWSDYTKKQRRETIDSVIAEMVQAGINSRRFEEIMEGIGAAFK